MVSTKKILTLRQARMCRSHQRRREKLQLGTKPSYYIVLGRSSIIAGLMQVEIMAIISPAEVEDAGVFMSKSLCEEVDGSHLVDYRKLRAGYNALLFTVSHLYPTSPPITPVTSHFLSISLFFSLL